MRRALVLLLAVSCSAPTRTDGRVTLITDVNGWPHIFAPTLREASAAEGYAMARDRMAQLELFRRTANGRLAEAFGAISGRFLESDVTMRTLGLRRVADELWAQTPQHGRTRDVLEGFADGVNLYLADVREGRAAPARGAELLVHARTPDWEPADSLAILRLMELFLSFNADAEIERTLLRDRAGPELFAQLVRWAPPSKATTVPGFYAPAPRAEPAPWRPLNASTAVLDSLRRVLPQGERLAVGTNAWAVSGAHSASGHALLANDPHLPLTAPSMLYGVHFVVTEGPDAVDVTGTAFPGVPGVVFGHNARVAWGICNAMLDQMDVYEETLTADTALFEGVQFPLERRVERIANGTGGFTDVTVEVVPHHGPILPVFSSEGVIAPRTAEHALSVRWVALAPSHEVDGLIALMFSGDVDEAQRAVRPIETPGMAFVLADSRGEVAFRVTGRVPLRPPGVEPAFVLPGEGGAEWLGWLSADELPHASGQPFIAAANNDPAGLSADGNPFDGPVYLGYDWAEGFRAERIAERLGELDGHATLEDLQQLQGDTVMLVAKRFAPWVPFTWNFDARADSVGAAKFHQWLAQVMDLALSDEVGSLGGPQLGPKARMLAVLAMLERPEESPLWDDVRTPGVKETKADVLKRAALGLAEVPWGTLHTLRLESVLPHFALALGADLTIPPREQPAFERGGGIETVDQGWPVMEGGDFRQTNGAARRLTVELTPEGPRAFDALPGGLTVDAWRANTPHALPRTREEVEAAAASVTKLDF